MAGSTRLIAISAVAVVLLMVLLYMFQHGSMNQSADLQEKQNVLHMNKQTMLHTNTQNMLTKNVLHTDKSDALVNPGQNGQRVIRQPHESINSGLPKVSVLNKDMKRTLGRYTIPQEIDLAEWKATLETYLKLPVDKEYGSHSIPLLVAAYLTEGDYLELGTGFFSTPIFHNLAKIRHNKVVSAESDPKWIVKLKEFKDSFHDVFYIKTEENSKEEAPDGFEVKDGWSSVGGDRHWGMIFVDHAPGAQRAVDIQRLENQGDIIVNHDSQPKMNYFYKTQPPLQRFKYRYSFAHHSHFRPSTDLVSNTRPDLLMLIRTLSEYTIRYLGYIPVEP